MTEARPDLLLWDHGSLTRENVTGLGGLTQRIWVTAGPRSLQLREALNATLPAGTVTDLVESAHSPEAAVRLAAALEGPAPILVTGFPFDAQTWVQDLIAALHQTHIEGFATLIPGAPGAPLTSVALTPEAVGYSILIRAGLADALGVGVAAAGGVPQGESAAVSAVRNQNGPVLLIWATKEYQPALPEPSAKPVRASDIIHAILNDTGLEVTNRTDMSAELSVKLGSADGTVKTTLNLVLKPGERRDFSAEELGEVGKLSPPSPELRQWSHEAQVVYVGGERRIHGVSVRYLSGSSVLGEDTFGAPNALVVATVSTEIARATGRSARSVSRRLSELAARQDWTAVLKALTASD